MASAFKPPVPVIGWRKRNPEIIYCFDSINKAANFTHADAKSVMQVCKLERIQARGWCFCYDGTAGAELLKKEAKRKIFHCAVIVA